MRQFAAGIPWRSLVASMTLLDSHDRARFHSVVGKNHARHIAGLCMLMTYPGVPSVFAGDEVGLEGAWEKMRDVRLIGIHQKNGITRFLAPTKS